MATLQFRQVDVFSGERLKGNGLAVVVGADEVSDATMAAFANWTNLAETTFLLRPTQPEADYRVRIFTPDQELPFAGHPTLGSCHVWLETGGVPQGDLVVQECGVGLVRIRRDGPRLAFAAPPLRRSGTLEPELLARITQGLGLSASDIVASSWLENGPQWVGVLLRSRAAVLALRPDVASLDGLEIGVVAPADGDTQFELRAFTFRGGLREDPVTGSLNAGVAQWLIGAGLAPEHYVASQGTAIGRAGRVHVDRMGKDFWIGGQSVTCIEGHVTL